MDNIFDKEKSREERLDDALNIRTANDLEEIKALENHTYEGTDYVTLDIIIDMLELGENDVLVDLGCGLGKVIYYVNHKVGCRTVGVEGDERIFKLLSENHDNYNKKSGLSSSSGGNVLVLGNTSAPVKIVQSRVEDLISISEDILDNCRLANDGSLYFYFFILMFHIHVMPYYISFFFNDLFDIAKVDVFAMDKEHVFFSADDIKHVHVQKSQISCIKPAIDKKT